MAVDDLDKLCWTWSDEVGIPATRINSRDVDSILLYKFGLLVLMLYMIEDLVLYACWKKTRSSIEQVRDKAIAQSRHTCLPMVFHYMLLTARLHCFNRLLVL